MLKTCDYCGAEFEAVRRTSKYCGLACLHASMRRTARATCKTCGVQFERKPWQMRRSGRVVAQYCSRRCSAAAHPGRPRIPRDSITIRACAHCGANFTVDGARKASLRRRFCSPACASRSRAREHESAQVLSQTDAAYLAGLLDAGGRLSLYSRGGALAIRLVLRNGSEQLFSWIMSRTGVGKLHANSYAPWNWWCSSDAAASLLEQLRPYLVVHASEVDAALEIQRGRRDPKLRRDAAWQRRARERMRALAPVDTPQRRAS